VATYSSLLASGSWRPIRHCPGRSLWTGATGLLPKDLVGQADTVQAFRVPVAPDVVHVVAFDDGGGLISYEKPDGTFVHTLNTPDGFTRKLTQLGISLART
jgi:hypothetical protein